MTTSQFVFIFVCVALTMVACRVIPLFALKGRSLSPNVMRALNLIPPAAYAALVANDLLSPTMFANGVWEGCIPLIAAAVVLAVGYFTKSLLWCIVVGIAAYALLLFVF